VFATPERLAERELIQLLPSTPIDPFVIVAAGKRGIFLRAQPVPSGPVTRARAGTQSAPR
jgi:hypothetical protein